MNGDVIFLLGHGDGLHTVPRTPYENEDLLQVLIEQYPAVLSGEQIDGDSPIRWLLVGREAGIPDSTGASERWSLDHLLIDNHAVPTFVEVKRSTDTRIRREVVGQMLDYAANAHAHWPIDKIRALAGDRYGGSDGADAEVRRLLGGDPAVDNATASVENFWQKAQENLRNGKLRLLFVADEIPRELRRIIEFLNDQMERTEVLGIELRQYVGDGIKALVPRLVGRTEAAAQRQRMSSSSTRTTPEQFLNTCSPEVRPVFESVITVASERGCDIYWGTKGFSVRQVLAENILSTLYCYPPGTFNRSTPCLQFYMKDVSDPDQLRAALLKVPGVQAKGQYTLDLTVSPTTVAQAKGALDLYWAHIDRLHTEASKAQPRPL